MFVESGYRSYRSSRNHPYRSQSYYSLAAFGLHDRSHLKTGKGSPCPPNATLQGSPLSVHSPVMCYCFCVVHVRFQTGLVKVLPGYTILVGHYDHWLQQGQLPMNPYVIPNDALSLFVPRRPRFELPNARPALRLHLYLLSLNFES